jgi:hypothetical protein
MTNSPLKWSPALPSLFVEAVFHSSIVYVGGTEFIEHREKDYFLMSDELQYYNIPLSTLPPTLSRRRMHWLILIFYRNFISS